MLNETLAIQSQLMYIEPAALTGIISAATAVAVAIGAAGIILWRKFKRGVAKTLHIDENAHKEVEEDIIIRDEEIMAEAAAAAELPEEEVTLPEEEVTAVPAEAPAEEVKEEAEEAKSEEAPKKSPAKKKAK